MHSPTAPAGLDAYVEAFESAPDRGGPADLARFLPDPCHPLYAAVLGELIRIDLEFSWRQGAPRRLEDYRPHFPALFQDREALQGLAYEEYRLRRQAGESPSPAEYLERFGFAVGFWPRPQRPGGGPCRK